MVKECLREIRKKTDFVPQVALILGTGLGGLTEELDKICTIDYKDLPGFPVSTAPGHRGKLHFGYFGSTRVVIMEGRVHYYEGYSQQQLRIPIRLLKALGAETLFLTNASGSVNPLYEPGDFMLLKDHILSFYPSPLIGPEEKEFGPRFFDLRGAYDEGLQKLILETAEKLNIPIHQGIYAQFPGPSLETAAEIRMLGILGADAVGFSTASETVIARQLSMRVCAIACITDKGAGLSDVIATREEIHDTARRSAPAFRKLIRTTIEAMNQL